MLCLQIEGAGTSTNSDLRAIHISWLAALAIAFKLEPNTDAREEAAEFIARFMPPAQRH